MCINCGGFDKDIMVEYKSGSGSISTSTIKNQFIERHLFNANSLDQIQWRMEGTTLTKDQLVTWLTDNKASIVNLKKGKISDLLDNESIINITDSQAADMLINYFKNDKNYLKLFK